MIGIEPLETIKRFAGAVGFFVSDKPDIPDAPELPPGAIFLEE